MIRFAHALILSGVGWLGAGPLAAQRALPLEDAVAQALATAPRRAAAEHSVQRAASGRRELAAQWWPRLSADGQVVRHQEPMIVRPFHSFNPAAPPDFDRTLMQGQVGLGWLVFDGGARRGRIDEADAIEAGARARLDGTEQGVIGSVVEAYLQGLHAAAAVEAQSARSRALAAEADRVGQFLAQGRAAPVDRLRVDAALAAARADSISAAGQVRTAEAALARAMGVPVDSVRGRPLLPVALRDTVVPPVDVAVRAAVAASPALHEAAARTEAATAARRAASAQWFPSVQLEGRTVAYGAADSRFTAEWQAGVRFSYPIFTGGSRSAGVARADATVREAAALEADLTLAIAEQVDRLVVQLEETEGRMAALAAARDQLVEVVRTEALALSEGAGLQSEYLRAEADLARARVDLSAARHRRMLVRVDLARVMGHLSTDVLPILLEGGR